MFEQIVKLLDIFGRNVERDYLLLYQDICSVASQKSGGSGFDQNLYFLLFIIFIVLSVFLPFVIILKMFESSAQMLTIGRLHLADIFSHTLFNNYESCFFFFFISACDLRLM